MRLALSCEIEPDIARVLGDKLRLLHQLDPPMSWAAIDHLAAIRWGAPGVTGFSDGRTLVWCRGQDTLRWDLPAHCPGLARLIAERGRAQDRPQGVPRALPVGGLRDGRMLWSVPSYRDDHRYVADLLLLDPASQRVDLLARDGERELTGSEPRCVLEGDEPAVCYVTGKIDAGALVHLDDFIMVETCWRVDLGRGTYAPHQGPALRLAPPPEPLLACTSQGYIDRAGFRYFGDERLERRAGRIGVTAGAHRFELDDPCPDLPSDIRCFLRALADGHRLLVLDLRAGDHARVYVEG